MTTSTCTSFRLLDLPTDIVLEVIDQLDVGHNPTQDIKTTTPLKNPAAVSHYFHSLLSPRLFKTLRCTYDVSAYHANPKTIWKTLNQTWILGNVRTLALKFSDSRLRGCTDIAGLDAIFLKIIQACSDLQSITVVVNSWQNCILGRQSRPLRLPSNVLSCRVTNLHVTCYSIPGLLLAHCPNVTHLRLTCSFKD